MTIPKCPFCGLDTTAATDDVRVGGGKPFRAVHCAQMRGGCGATGPLMLSDDGAHRMWRRRVGPVTANITLPWRPLWWAFCRILRRA